MNNGYGFGVQRAWPWRSGGSTGGGRGGRSSGRNPRWGERTRSPRISTYRRGSTFTSTFERGNFSTFGYGRLNLGPRPGGLIPRPFPTTGTYNPYPYGRINLNPPSGGIIPGSSKPGGVVPRPTTTPPTNPPPNNPSTNPAGGPGGNSGAARTTEVPGRMGSARAGDGAGGSAGGGSNTGSSGARVSGILPGAEPGTRGVSGATAPAFGAAVASAAAISYSADQTETMQASVQGSNEPGTGAYSGSTTNETMQGGDQMGMSMVSTAQGASPAVESTTNANTEGGDANVPGPQTFPNQINPNLVAAAQSSQGTPQPTNNNGKRAIIGANNNIIGNCFGGSTGVNSTSVKPALNISLTNKPTNNQSYMPGGCFPTGTTGTGSSTGGVAVGTSRGQSGGNSLLSGTVTAGTGGRVHIPLHGGPGGWFGELGGKQGNTPFSKLIGHRAGNLYKS